MSKNITSYLDSTPTHSYMKALYKYPQAAYPYQQLVEQNAPAGGRHQPEYELIDTGVFNENRYFDVFIEYAKVDSEDILIQISVESRAGNRKIGRSADTLVPQLRGVGANTRRVPHLRCSRATAACWRNGMSLIKAEHALAGTCYLACQDDPKHGPSPELLFTENDTNFVRLYGASATTRRPMSRTASTIMSRRAKPRPSIPQSYGNQSQRSVSPIISRYSPVKPEPCACA